MASGRSRSSSPNSNSRAPEAGCSSVSELLDRNVRVNVVIAHERGQRATGEPLHDFDQLCAHRAQERATHLQHRLLLAILDIAQAHVTEVGVAVSDRSLIPLARRCSSDPAKSRGYFVV
jgi:hypothetical protein